jgi:hypothetical protein
VRDSEHYRCCNGKIITVWVEDQILKGVPQSAMTVAAKPEVFLRILR